MIRDLFRMLSVRYLSARRKVAAGITGTLHVLPEEPGQGKEERSELRALSRILPRV